MQSNFPILSVLELLPVDTISPNQNILKLKMKLAIFAVFAALVISSGYAGVIGLGAGCCGPAAAIGIVPAASVVGFAPATTIVGPAASGLALGTLGHGKGLILG